MTPSHRTTRRFGWRTLAPTGLGAALAVAVAASLTGGGGGLALPGGSPSRPAGATGTPTELDDAAPVSLNTFDDCAALLDHYRSTALPDVGPWGLGGPSPIRARGVGIGGDSAAGSAAAAAPDAPMATQAPERTAADGTTSAAGTNVQVAGVDEADIVKRVGDLLLVLAQDRAGGQSLQIVRTSADGRATPIGRLATDWWPSSMLVDGQTVLLLGTTGMAYPMGGAADRMMMPIGIERTRIDQIDLSDPTRPRRVRSMMLDGSAAGARMVDGVVRVALTSWPRLAFTTRPVWGGGPMPIVPEAGQPTVTVPGKPGPSSGPSAEPELTESELTERNKSVVRSSTIDDWLPRYDLTESDGTQSSGRLLQCEDVAAPTTPSGVSTLTLLGIDLRGGGLTDWHSSAVVASGSTVYATADRTVVATPANPFAIAGKRGTVATQLHAFDTSGRGTARYLAGGEVAGTLLNQFSMDYYDGALRVASTDETQSRVTVLREQGKRLLVTGSRGRAGQGRADLRRPVHRARRLRGDLPSDRPAVHPRPG